MKHPIKNIEKRVAIIGCLNITKDLILGMARHGYHFDRCITFRPTLQETAGISGYCDLTPNLNNMGVPVTIVEKYNMGSDTDREKLQSLDIDIAIVYGWQRLVPKWFLDYLSIGAFGAHGSGKPLPFGRGRSPVNWSIIQGKRTFFSHLFKYDTGIDDGPVAAVQEIEITAFDTCQTLLNKCTIAMVNMCLKELPSIIDGTVILKSQDGEGASYYPKRNKEDGIIDWEDATSEIYNLVRAVARPYPGAFSFLENKEDKSVLIWRAIPFDTPFIWPLAGPGEIVEVFCDGTFIVRTGDSALFVLESEGHEFSNEDIGKKFGNANIKRKRWPDLPV